MPVKTPQLAPERRSMHRPVKITSQMLTLSLPRRLTALPTPDNPMVIHQSELATWLRCRVKWFLRYQLRLIRKGGARNLEMGSIYHHIHESWYTLPPEERGRKAMRQIAKLLAWSPTLLDEHGRPKPVLALSNEDRTLIEAMANSWAIWCKDPANPTNDREIGLDLAERWPEMEFEYPLGDGSIIVRGRLDMPFKPTIYKGAIACIETKTRSQFRDENLEQMLQGTTYLWAMHKRWPKKKRYSIWFQRSRKQMPGPRVRAALHDRQEITRTEEELVQWEVDTFNACIDMLGAAIYPSPEDSCLFTCDFQGPCILRGNPADVKHVLKHEYIHKEEDER